MARAGDKRKGKNDNKTKGKIPDVIPMTQIAQTEDGQAVVKRVRPLTYALLTFVKSILNMEDTVDISDDESSAQWGIEISIGEEKLTASFITFEDDCLITFDIYFGQFSLSPKQLKDIEHFIIETNNKLIIGHIQIADDYIRYHSSIDVSGIASDDPEYSGPHVIPPQLLANMFEYGNDVAERFSKELAEKVQG
jgi:hypothetical protein